MRLLLVKVITFFVFFATNLQAQQAPQLALGKPVKDTLALKLDSSKTQVKEFGNQSIQKYKEQKEFQYGDDEPKGLSWWDRFWRNFWDWINRLFGQRESTSSGPSMWPSILKYGAMAICIVLVVFIIFKLAGVDFKWFAGKSKAVDVPYDESLENIHEISFEDEISNTLQKGNYRLAVRLLYLQTLKHLSDREIIDWQPNKTNVAYVREMQGEKGEEAFANLTYQFEYIWYGDFPVDRTAFAQIQQSFQQFNGVWR
ncbi:DUF4129 domain-containing protein [Pedobacter xixiisoli]|uniref:Protein-glutamine gamma-glutamyltransferase-like C-terminal domain-containing protein n=1 Tax=Pedobacter xixiisoli TaxID=1476464 RepID=A0A286AEA3_9SPHI|nr:DUF4129 domain-containing protein [Pedobacter xixiisoli]SOD20221.1 protein of unknown function [Pedobacter xixiisoli]